MFKYADRSAVALAFSPDYGKCKLFITKAFGKSGGFMAFVPGSLTFNMKDNSDLNRFVAFNHDPDFFKYTSSPGIIARLNISYDFFDNLFNVGELCPALWQLTTKFNDENYRKITIYTIYRLFKEAGLMFNLSTCTACAKSKKVGYLRNGEFICADCSGLNRDGAYVDEITKNIIDSLGDNDLVRKLEITASDERQILDLFHEHLISVTGKGLKSYPVFLSMQDATF